MTDITERLKKLVGVYIGDADIDNDLLDAINEFERLQSRIDELENDMTYLRYDINVLKYEIECLKYELSNGAE